MITDILSELGLTPLEIKLYVSLLEEGPNISGALARKTNSHRRNVYDALDRLLTKGLVSYMKDGNIKTFRASSPTFVLEQLRAKQKEWESLIPNITKKMNDWDTKKETLFFRGQAGIKNVFLDQIEKGKEILVVATSHNCTTSVAHFFPKYQLLREEKKIKMKMLFDNEILTDPAFAILKKLKLTQLRTIAKSNSTPTSKYIYGDTVAIITWHENPFAIVIREPVIAQFEKQQFELIWSQGKPVRR